MKALKKTFEEYKNKTYDDVLLKNYNICLIFRYKF